MTIPERFLKVPDRFTLIHGLRLCAVALAIVALHGTLGWSSAAGLGVLALIVAPAVERDAA